MQRKSLGGKIRSLLFCLVAVASASTLNAESLKVLMVFRLFMMPVQEPSTRTFFSLSRSISNITRRHIRHPVTAIRILNGLRS